MHETTTTPPNHPAPSRDRCRRAPRRLAAAAALLVLLAGGAAASAEPAQAGQLTDYLHDGESLGYLNHLSSPNGLFEAVFEPSGDFVLYQNTPGGRVATWSTGTSAAGGRLVNQPDGNLVVYTASGAPVWASGTADQGSSMLLLEDDGELVLYGPHRRATWSSGTARTAERVGCRSDVAGIGGAPKLRTITGPTEVVVDAAGQKRIRTVVALQNEGRTCGVTLRAEMQRDDGWRYKTVDKDEKGANAAGWTFLTLEIPCSTDQYRTRVFATWTPLGAESFSSVSAPLPAFQAVRC